MMRKFFRVNHIIVILVVVSVSCNQNNRQSEEAQGRETEIAGDEPDETEISNDSKVDNYNPGDTVVNVQRDEVPPYLQEHLQVLVDTYLDLEESLVMDNSEEAKEKAQQINDILKRHEQENMDLEPQVKEFYTNAAHIVRQSAQNIISANELWEISAAFSSMGPAAYKLAKMADLADINLYYQFCAQSFDNRGAYWLSRSKEPKNPYSGEQELKNCGETVGMLSFE